MLLLFLFFLFLLSLIFVAIFFLRFVSGSRIAMGADDDNGVSHSGTSRGSGNSAAAVEIFSFAFCLRALPSSE